MKIFEHPKNLDKYMRIIFLPIFLSKKLVKVAAMMFLSLAAKVIGG